MYKHYVLITGCIDGNSYLKLCFSQWKH